MTRVAFAGWSAAVMLCLIAMAIVSGGLMVAPVLGVGGALAIPFALAARPRPQLKPYHVLLAVFFLWVALTSLWSPYDSKENVFKLLIGPPLYGLFAYMCARFADPERRRARAALVFAAVWGAAGLMAELVTHGGVSSVHFPPEAELEMYWRSLGHGASVLTVITPAVLVICWRAGLFARWTSLAVAAATIVFGVGFGITANLLGVLVALAATVAGALRPRATITAVGAATASFILFAPLLAPISHAFTRGALEAMPLSWELRVFGWRVVARRIGEAPIFGHGFDSVRLLSQEMTLKGEVMDVVRLHPHNAGLHIWYETGAIGAVLAAALFAMITRRIAKAPGLTRAQAAAAAGGAGAYVANSLVGYGAWQEWWIATAFLAATAAMLAGPPVRPSPRS